MRYGAQLIQLTTARIYLEQSLGWVLLSLEPTELTEIPRTKLFSQCHLGGMNAQTAQIGARSKAVPGQVFVRFVSDFARRGWLVRLLLLADKEVTYDVDLAMLLSAVSGALLGRERLSWLR